MVINLVAAIDQNRALGYKGDMLTYISDDLKRFRKLTENSPCVMGRTTYESILNHLNRPLPNRDSLVLTNDHYYLIPYDNAYIYNSIEDILHEYNEYADNDNLWVVGGGKVYEQFLPYADNIHLTIIEHKFDNADAYFPVIDLSEWKVVKPTITNKSSENNPYNFSYVTYTRKHIQK